MPGQTIATEGWVTEATGWRLRSRFLSLLDWVRAGCQRARQRRQLAGLDARLLDDIGLTREQAGEEAAKPFWVE